MTHAGNSRLEIEHKTLFKYENPVQQATMVLRLEPFNNEFQRVHRFEFEFEPDASPVSFIDSFGNHCHLVDFQPNDKSSVTVTSKSEVSTSAQTVLDDNPLLTWSDLKACVDSIKHWPYLVSSNRVYTCAQLDRFLGSNSIQAGDNPYSALHDAANAIYQNIQYEPGTTQVSSKIEDCLEQLSGVCQDFTHIMLAIGRSWGIPSRYVSGYLHLFPEQNRIITEKASHAWGEFFLPEFGWFGIDATNDTIVDHRYVRISTGRDYDDAAPTQGVVFGGGHSTLDVDITLTQISSVPSANPLPGAAQQ